MSRLRQFPVWQFARMTFVLAGVMLLTLFLLAHSAQAGCGDYVFVRNASGQLVRASTLMKEHPQHGACSGPNCPGHNPLATPMETVPVPPEANLPLKVPCHGPNCSGDSPLPAVPVPPPAPRTSSQESTALLLKWNHGSAQPDTWLARAALASDDELHYPQSIFHPPR